MTTISVSEILDELAQAAKRTDAPKGFQTIPELCVATGWGESKLRRNLKVAQAAGCLEVVKVMRQTLAGTMQPVPAYKVLAPKKGKRG